jgi:hypothetical protein
MRMTELQKMYHRARGRWSKNAGKEEQRKADFHAMREKKAFTPHMMYDPKTGKGYKAEKEADHLRMKKMGYGHEKPEIKEGTGKPESWEAGYKRRVIKTTDPEHKEKGYNWRIKGKDRSEISIKLYKSKPDQAEFNRQMKRVAGHEFGG